MQSTSPPADPLTILPPELALRIVEFASISAIASLTAVSKAWHQFIDFTHQDAIYASKLKSAQSSCGAPRDLSSLSNIPTFSKWFDDTASWKNLCKRKTQLARNWASPRPVSRERVFQVGNDPVWRFRADLKRRFIVSTSHAGGLNVTDIDTGQIIWRLPSTLDSDHEEAVRPYAHLEYQDGMAVFDREGDAVEVWQADQDGAARGEFRRMAVLEHDCQTRGFQLSYGTLCVVSTEGQGFVYDMTQRPPKLTTHLEIENDAVGHLDQSEDAVMYSMGPRGYHVYNKASGEFMGALQPSQCTKKYHIRPPATNYASSSTRLMGITPREALNPSLSPGPPSKDRMVPIKLDNGPLPPPTDTEHVRHGEDEWGSGMEDGNLFVGVSRAGRVFVCSDWRKALHDPTSFAECSAVIECESDGSSFDLGGWLSVRNHRLMFEIQDRIYIVALDDDNRIQAVDHATRGSYSLPTCSTPQLAVPISFMALYDDTIMSTYTAFARRQRPIHPDGVPPQQEEGPARIFPTKTIRIISLAPDASVVESANPDGNPAQVPSEVSEGLWETNRHSAPAEEIVRSQALLQLLSMLRDEYGDVEGDESDDAWEDVDEDEDEDENEAQTV
ncbi:hypothetical protein BDW59DRAFT_96637 [Aspergillus cavernicola]|uniref:F-box domain-containing protein n=1 Tax=Aspergillus cavernicola TaxID=176166 RepID=A0ABR4I755_9EURO